MDCLGDLPWGLILVHWLRHSQSIRRSIHPLSSNREGALPLSSITTPSCWSFFIFWLLVHNRLFAMACSMRQREWERQWEWERDRQREMFSSNFIENHMDFHSLQPQGTLHSSDWDVCVTDFRQIIELLETDDTVCSDGRWVSRLYVLKMQHDFTSIFISLSLGI